MSGYAIEFREVTHGYVTHSSEAVLALQGINITIEPGQFVCVVGPSGCGKTTILKLVAGFQMPTHGDILCYGEPISGPDANRGVVFQQPNLYPWFSVEDNVAFGLRLRGFKRKERIARAAKYLELVGLEGFPRARPYELSGGMQQRAQIARVLATDPGIILMDEPFGALDALTRAQLQADLLEIQRTDRKTVLFITHSVEEAIFLGDRVLVMSPRPGHVVLDLPVELSKQTGRMLGPEMRALPEFIALREEAAAAITATASVR